MAAVKLTGNFLATARCLIFADGGGIVWTFNSNTNTLQASGSGGGVTGLATPTAKVGLTTVAGTATTAMRSDGAPPIDQAIIPTWTGLHTFNAGLTVGGGTTTISGHTLTLSANASVGGTNTGDQTIPVGANPSASIGLAAVNGVAATWMRSDGAPALNQAIAPTWTGNHIFSAGSGVPVVINPVATYGLQIFGGSGGGLACIATGGTFATNDSFFFNNATTFDTFLGSRGNTVVHIQTNGADRVTISGAGAVTVAGALGVNGASPPAKVTGWGTPTGQAVVASFAAGATPSLLQMSEAVAQIITDLKAFGIYGA